MVQKVILDVDTGSDDAIAILLAALHPQIELVACLTVRGNVELPDSTENTLRTLQLVGREDVPVYMGMARPVARPDFPIPRASDDAGAIHARELPLPPARQRAQAKTAIEFLIETYRAATEDIILVTSGPLSNLAMAIKLDPSIVERIPEVVSMGGGHAFSNRTAAAESNIWSDPEGASIVLGAGLRKMTLVPLDATLQALIDGNQALQIHAIGTPAAKFVGDLLQSRIVTYDSKVWPEPRGTGPVHDACCIGYVIDRSLLTTKRYHVDVETSGQLTLGRTVVDVRSRGGIEPNCNFAVHADGQKLFELFNYTFRQ